MIKRVPILLMALVVFLAGCMHAQKSSETVHDIVVNIDKDFRYVRKGWPMGLAVGQTPGGGLNKAPFERLWKEPPYPPGQVRYGYIELGNSSDSMISFALHESADGVFTMYVDLNNNEDLSDDGPPLQNQGTGKFASQFSLLVDILTNDGKTIQRPYNLWLWINGEGSKMRPRFYARCYYEGPVTLDGKQFNAIAYEFSDHDALYNGSGLWIDLNRDGKLTRETEFFPENSPRTIKGQTYRLVKTSNEAGGPVKPVVGP